MIIKGDSGTGKTALVETLNARSDFGVSIEILKDGNNIYQDHTTPNFEFDSTKLSIIPYDNGTWQSSFDNRNAIIILDDLNSLHAGIFHKNFLAKAVDNNLFYIIQDRTSLDYSDNLHDVIDDSLDDLEETFIVEPSEEFHSNILSKFGALSIDSNNIFRMQKQNNRIRILEKMWVFNDVLQELQSNPSLDINYVHMEDLGKGLLFFKNLFKGLTINSHSGGKDALAHVIHETCEYRNQNVLVIFDSVAYGCQIEELFHYSIIDQINIYTLQPYRSFEEILLKSRLFRFHPTVIDMFDRLCNEFLLPISLEKCYEEMLEQITEENRKLRYVHSRGKLKKCYYENCKNCQEYERANCCIYNSHPELLNEDKFVWLLSGSEYEYLLEIRKFLCTLYITGESKVLC